MGVRTDESITGNTLHAFLILVSCVVVFVVRKRLSRAALIYTLVVASTFLLFSIVFNGRSLAAAINFRSLSFLPPL